MCVDMCARVCELKQAHVVNFAVLGMDVRIADGVYINGAIVCPHKSIKSTHLEPNQIVM